MKTLDDARALAETMLALGEQAGREVVCLLTDMDQPLGAAVGNALEVREALATVRGDGPARLHRARARRCARLLALSDLGIDVAEGRGARRGRRRRRLGRGRLEPLDRGAGRHGRRVGARARPRSCARSRRRAAGAVVRLDAIRVGVAALHLGAGRRVKGDTIDHAVGVVCRRKRGDLVEEGERPRRDSRARRGRRGRRPRARSRPPTSSATSRRRRGPVLLEVIELSTRPAAARLACSRARAARGRERQAPARARPRGAAARAGRDRGRAADASRSIPVVVARELEGERVVAVDRRGKYLIVRFESGRALLVHLRMTGSLRLRPRRRTRFRTIPTAVLLSD